MESSCEHGNELSGSIKCGLNYRVASQLVACRVLPSSTELVSYCIQSLNETSFHTFICFTL
jgi:hypothetical protein